VRSKSEILITAITIFAYNRKKGCKFGLDNKCLFKFLLMKSLKQNRYKIQTDYNIQIEETEIEPFKYSYTVRENAKLGLTK